MNSENCNIEELLHLIPQQEPFRFVDEITYIDDSRIEGHYCLHENNSFYPGHFPGYPITPGVILIEVMAQIGLVAFGLYLTMKEQSANHLQDNSIPVLAAAKVSFRKLVFAGEVVFVESQKILFRHGKLVCKVKLFNKQKELVSEGLITGFSLTKN